VERKKENGNLRLRYSAGVLHEEGSSNWWKLLLSYSPYTCKVLFSFELSPVAWCAQTSIELSSEHCSERYTQSRVVLLCPPLIFTRWARYDLLRLSLCVFCVIHIGHHPTVDFPQRDELGGEFWDIAPRLCTQLRHMVRFVDACKFEGRFEEFAHKSFTQGLCKGYK
jgi:hypothetical protein